MLARLSSACSGSAGDLGCCNWAPLLALQVAERAITQDLELLIAQSVDPKKADFAGWWGGSRALRGWGVAVAFSAC